MMELHKPSKEGEAQSTPDPPPSGGGRLKCSGMIGPES